MFCWFVKEKGLVPDTLFDERKLTANSQLALRRQRSATSNPFFTKPSCKIFSFRHAQHRNGQARLAKDEQQFHGA
jgi:hypothetical protein